MSIIFMAKLFILLHDGTLEGDNQFFPGSAEAFPYSPKTSLDDLRAAYAQRCLKGDPNCDQADVDDYAAQVKGGWILTEAGLRALDEFMDCLPEALGDRSCYANNHATKRYLTLKAKGFLGPKPK